MSAETLFGCIWLLFGIFWIVCSISGGIAAKEIDTAIASSLVGMLSVIMGYSFIRTDIQYKKLNKETEEYGDAYYCRIIKYKDGKVHINNVPILIVTVAYYDEGKLKTIDVNTRQTSEAPYPLGANAILKIYKDYAKIADNSVGREVQPEIDDAITEYIDKLNSTTI